MDHQLISMRVHRDTDGSSAEGRGLLAGHVARAAQGDRSAFAALIRVFRPEVQRVALRLVGNHEDAEDLAQESFIRGWRGLTRFTADCTSPEGAAERLGPWLLGITVHLARDLQRKRSRAPRREAAAVALQLTESLAAKAADGPEAQGKHRETQALLDAALASLPERLRTAIVLRAFEGLDYATIAEITGLRAATVRTQVVQARRALKRILGPALDTNPDPTLGGDSPGDPR